MTRKEFLQHYWRYYLVLEEKFKNTLNYIELDWQNAGTFSNEYALLLQSIGAELDNFFKVYCGFAAEDRKNMNDYCTFIVSKIQIFFINFSHLFYGHDTFTCDNGNSKSIFQIIVNRLFCNLFS